jgi:hypothetical protein
VTRRPYPAMGCRAIDDDVKNNTTTIIIAPVLALMYFYISILWQVLM